APNIRTTRVWGKIDVDVILDHASERSVKSSGQPYRVGSNQGFIGKTSAKRHQLAVVRFSRVDNPRGGRKTNRRRIVSDRSEGGNLIAAQVIPQFANPEIGGRGRRQKGGAKVVHIHRPAAAAADLKSQMDGQ